MPKTSTRLGRTELGTPGWTRWCPVVMPIVKLFSRHKNIAWNHLWNPKDRKKIDHPLNNLTWIDTGGKAEIFLKPKVNCYEFSNPLEKKLVRWFHHVPAMKNRKKGNHVQLFTCCLGGGDDALDLRASSGRGKAARLGLGRFLQEKKRFLQEKNGNFRWS